MVDKKTSYSLVSDGAEAILLSKKFFLQHLSENLQKKLRTTVSLICTVTGNIYECDSPIRPMKIEANQAKTLHKGSYDRLHHVSLVSFAYTRNMYDLRLYNPCDVCQS